MGWHANKKDPKRKKYTVVGKDHLGIQRQMPAFRDAALSRELARNIARFVEHRANNTPLPPLLGSWANDLAPSIRDRLAAWDLLGEHARPLSDHITDYEAALRARNSTEQHVRQTVGRIMRIMQGCQFVYWGDVQGSRVQRFLSELRLSKKHAASAQTKNYYLRDFKSFCRWAVRDGRLGQSPVEYLRPIDAKRVRSYRRRERRAASVNEISKLLAVTAAEPERFGMTGPERAVLYRVTIETGLRAAELACLQKAHLDIESNPPAIILPGSETKNGLDAVIPLRPATAAILRRFAAAKVQKARLFSIPDSTKTARMLRADLQAAGVSYQDEAGRVLDFHALRHTCGTWLAAAGVHPKVIQRIMRHSTITLTMDRYTHAFKSDEVEAVARFPDLPEAGCAAGTGTDDASPPRSNTCSAKRGAQRGKEGGFKPHIPWTAMDSERFPGAGRHDRESHENPCVAGKNGDSDTGYNDGQHSGPVAESADAADLKSAGGQPP